MKQASRFDNGEEAIFRVNLFFCFAGNQLDPVCYLPKVVGPCRAVLPRYFYNKDTKRCQIFTYGGCGGNENNFFSLGECNNVCYCKYLKIIKCDIIFSFSASLFSHTTKLLKEFCAISPQLIIVTYPSA